MPNDETIKAMQECEKISQNDDIVEVDNVSNYLKGLVSNGFGLNQANARDIISARALKAYFDKMLGIRAKFGLKKVSESSSFS